MPDYRGFLLVPIVPLVVFVVLRVCIKIGGGSLWPWNDPYDKTTIGRKG